MTHSILKFAISAALIFAVAEIRKRSSLIGGLFASLPLVSLLAIIWLYHDARDTQKVAALSTSIFWLELPSLVLFIALKRGVTFWPSLGVSVSAIFACYGITVSRSVNAVSNSDETCPPQF